MFGLPLWALPILKAVKDFFSKLTWKHYAAFAGLLLFCFAQYKFYDWAKENGKEEQLAIDQPIIDDLNTKLTTAKNELNTYKTTFEQWKKDSAAANKLLEEKNAELSKLLSEQLAENLRLSKLKQKVLIREIPKFIPASVDVQLPSGFVQLYNHSIKTIASSEEYGVSFGPVGDATAPSGVTLSRASEILIYNNQECLNNRFMLVQWQKWYREAKKNFDEANAVKTDAVNVMQQTDDKIPAPTP